MVEFSGDLDFSALFLVLVHALDGFCDSFFWLGVDVSIGSGGVSGKLAEDIILELGDDYFLLGVAVRFSIDWDGAAGCGAYSNGEDLDVGFLCDAGDFVDFIECF